jgi:hypothetical protein
MFCREAFTQGGARSSFTLGYQAFLRDLGRGGGGAGGRGGKGGS